MTIKEFSAKLGLSTATVSRAFTPGTRIHPETRARILREARALGYAPNPNARSLAQKHRRIIGLDFPANADVLADLYLVELARGVQVAVQEADYGLLLNTLPRPGGDMALLQEWVFGRAVDGVVIVVPRDFPMETLCGLAGREVPCVLVAQGVPEPRLAMPTVALDLAEGAAAAMTHLLRLGHRRIGFLTSTDQDAVCRAYQDALRQEATLDPKQVIVTDSNIPAGRAAMHRLLALPERPTAVFCRTDVLALGALRAARDMGLRIPEQMSLIGHDDLPLAALADPPLTTVRIDTGRIGRAAIELLLAQLPRDRKRGKCAGTGHSAPDTLIAIETELVVRESTTQPA